MKRTSTFKKLVENRTAVATQVKGRVSKCHAGWCQLIGSKTVLVVVVHIVSESKCFFLPSSVKLLLPILWSQVRVQHKLSASFPMLFLNTESPLSQACRKYLTQSLISISKFSTALSYQVYLAKQHSRFVNVNPSHRQMLQVGVAVPAWEGPRIANKQPVCMEDLNTQDHTFISFCQPTR